MTIPQQISNLFLVMFSKRLYSSGKQSEETIWLQATYLEPKPSFLYIFWDMQDSLLIEVIQ